MRDVEIHNGLLAIDNGNANKTYQDIWFVTIKMFP